MFSRLVIAAITLFIAADTAQAAPPEVSGPLVYGGRLVDGSGRPVTGVFPLTFSIYTGANTKRALWTDSVFVAVDNGVYAIELGRTKALPKSLNLKKAEIGIALTGRKGDIVREPMEKAAAVTDARVIEVKPVGGATTGVKPSAANQQSYADVAGYAYESERAKVADRIGGLSETDLRDLAKSAATATQNTAPRVKIGNEKRFMESAGGSEGTPYAITCPAGYVVVGIRGGAGALVDSVSVICSPLE